MKPDDYTRVDDYTRADAIVDVLEVICGIASVTALILIAVWG